METHANGRPRFAFREPSTGSMTALTSLPPRMSTSPRSSDTATSGTPSASISRKTASSAARSIT